MYPDREHSLLSLDFPKTQDPILVKPGPETDHLSTHPLNSQKGNRNQEVKQSS